MITREHFALSLESTGRSIESGRAVCQWRTLGTWTPRFLEIGMKYPRCQAESEAGLKFCEDCGARLALTCLSGGAEVLPHEKFCGSCGAAAGLDPSELEKAEQHRPTARGAGSLRDT